MTTYARLRLPSCHDALFQAIRLIPVLAILAGALPRDAMAVIALVKNVGERDEHDGRDVPRR
jgi:hypothetical protein